MAGEKFIGIALIYKISLAVGYWLLAVGVKCIVTGDPQIIRVFLNCTSDGFNMAPGRKFGLLCLFFLLTQINPISFAQDTPVIKVHFIYGSKPSKQYRAVEKKWFGGIMGGHTGIEKDKNQFLSFEGNDKFHPIDHVNKRHCRYLLRSEQEFWDGMGSPGDSVKKVTVIIPINAEQKILLDRIAAAYVQYPPYDYSIFGMRCASATYEILAQLGIVKPYRYRGTCLRIFYPKILRKKLLKRAVKNGWTVTNQEGSHRRIWEKD